LLRSMDCSSRLEILPFLAPVMVEKRTPPPTKVTGKFQQKYLYIRAHKLIMHSVPTLSKLRSGTSCQTNRCALKKRQPLLLRRMYQISAQCIINLRPTNPFFVASGIKRIRKYFKLTSPVSALRKFVA
jgi:hypothetical protein